MAQKQSKISLERESLHWIQRVPFTKRGQHDMVVYCHCRSRTCSSALRTQLNVCNVHTVAVAKTWTNLKQRAGDELAPVPAIYRDEQTNLLMNNREAAAILQSFREA